MSSHPYAISRLTAAHSHDLLSQGRQRQLAKTVPSRPRTAFGQRARLVRSFVSRVLTFAGSLLRVPVPPRGQRRVGPDWAAPVATGQSVVARETS
jgi:hypothetical protein